MLAHFSKSQTTNVDEYMDARIGRTSNMSFVNSRIDGKLALDDHTTFYIRKYPGFIEIKLDKDENSDDAYHRIKAMCEGIKKVISK
jgi:6-phosphogluconolactonase/glucosamine-6-phosphate isomerase/deaminase